jgi:hypothetical protein
VLLALAVGGASAQVSQVVRAPVADHHVHLRSLAVNGLFTDGLPVIEVPGDVQTLLREFQAHWRARDARAFAALFTVDGLMQVEGGWRQPLVCPRRPRRSGGDAAARVIVLW